MSKSNSSNDESYTIVVGDVHGDLNQLLYPLLLFLSDPNKYTIVYVGDYIDRGECNVYVYEIIRVLHKHPKVHFLFGNHEMYDKSTLDYFAYRISKKGAYIKTFVYDMLRQLNLDVVYYDSNTKILYSHSPLNRPLSVVLKLPKTEESTYTYDVDSPKMEYKNIHGHDHRASTNELLKKFFTTREVNMISIDNDASYGFNIMQNAMTMKCENMMKDARSNVYYLIIDNNDIRNYKTVSKEIDYNSSDDYNVKSFAYIKSKMLVACANDGTSRYVDSMTLDVSYGEFMRQYSRMFGERGCKGLLNNLRRRYNTCVTKPTKIQATIYFHDIPHEYYVRFAANDDDDNKSLGADYDAILAKKYIPVHELYWKYVLGTWKPKENQLVKEGWLAGGEKTGTGVGQVYIIIAAIVFVSTVITMVVAYVYTRKSKNRSDELSIPAEVVK